MTAQTVPQSIILTASFAVRVEDVPVAVRQITETLGGRVVAADIFEGPPERWHQATAGAPMPALPRAPESTPGSLAGAPPAPSSAPAVVMGVTIDARAKRGKLNDEDVAAIRQLIEQGEKQREIAVRFGVSRAAIALISQGRLHPKKGTKKAAPPPVREPRRRTA